MQDQLWFAWNCLIRELRPIDMNGVVAGYEIKVVAPGQRGQVTSPRLDPRPLMTVGKL